MVQPCPDAKTTGNMTGNIIKSNQQDFSNSSHCILLLKSIN